MSKHTKGHFSRTCLGVNTGTISILAPEKETGWRTVLATVWAKNTSVEEAESNANLFAAAPDLLKALKLVLEHNKDLSDQVMRGPKLDSPAWRIKVAITKADPGYLTDVAAAKAEGA